ncbi:hypothetical protein [Micromonospora sp. HK10]|uniref:hypothetical protein n=1 Tax=Micromonospora sp. HK10 TaxID=1538294 RepID=UPI0006970363|nr:hypothetical protein [Micromonospora sp. HK10]
MTANRATILTTVTTDPPRWQAGWARCENERRQRAYEIAAEAWQRRADQLDRLRIEAAAFLGCTQPRAGLPVHLDDDEVVYRVLPSADLVEAQARHLTGLPSPTLTVATAPVDAPGRPLPAGLRVVDTGMAVVTNLRVAFAGSTIRREWWHADLRGPGHHPTAPLTLLHTSDGRAPAGLRVPAGAAVNFRFYLTLAVATATGRRALIAPQLDALVAAHDDARPAAPARVTPEDAPAPLVRPERLVAAAAVAVAVAIGSLTAGTLDAPAALPYRTGSAVSGSPDRPAGGSPAPLTVTGAADSGHPGAGTEPPRPTGTTPPTGGGAATGTTGTSARPAGTSFRPVGRGDAAGTTGTGRTVAVSGEPAAQPAAASPRPARTAPATPAPAPTSPPVTAPAPSDSPPSPDPGTAACLLPLRLPVVGPLLCPAA